MIPVRSTISPTTSLPQRRPVRLLVDEAHQQAWSVRPAVAARMQPGHPADSSYARAAALLADRDVEVVVQEQGRLDATALSDVDVVLIAHPSDPRHEATTGVGSPLFDAEERAALEAFVASGGGLVVLAESQQNSYGSNLNDVLSPFGLAVDHGTVQDYGRHHTVPSWVFAAPEEHPDADSLFHGVPEAVFYRTGTVRAEAPNARVVARSSATASPAGAGLVGVSRHGAGRVVLFGDSDLFGDDCLDEGRHADLWLNTVTWAALPRLASSTTDAASPIVSSSAWGRLLDAVASLRELQADDGSLVLGGDDQTSGPIAALVDEAAAALMELASALPRDAAYLTAAAADLRRWFDTGAGVPDFGRSLEAFRPELDREDGVEHVVLFPMYAPNGTTGKRFEALLVRVPWPTFASAVEGSTHPNQKFVPVHLLANTAGYDTECAVLFPETVSVAGTAANTFGGIFCDREAERFRSVTGAAVRAVSLSLPPRVEMLLAHEGLCRDTFLLWDLVHDRAHSRGDLPFDPFMIRQRMPFWMYALEELRCDLTAYVQAGEMASTFPFARHVQDAVVLDRMLRFPVTGTRVRNYDGLGGQVLFGYLHRHGVARWTDNTLVLDWDALPSALAGLLAEIQHLYRTGIDSSRVRYWIAAHDLVSRYVAPALASAWTPEARTAPGADLPAEDDAKAWVDRVLADEFPLNLFFRSLQGTMAPVFENRAAAFAAASTRTAVRV